MATDVDRKSGTSGAFSVVRRAARALDISTTLEQAGEQLLPLLAENAGAEQAFLWVIRRGASHPVIAAAWPASAATDDRVAPKTREAGVTWLEGTPDKGPALAVPVRAGDHLLGVLELRGPTIGEPNGPNEGVLEVLAGLVGQFLRRLEAEEQAAVAQNVVRPRDRLPAMTYIDALDGTSRTLYISPQAVELTGYTEQEWLADPELWERIVHPDDRERVLAENARTMAGLEPFRCEYRIVTRDGVVRWVRDEADLVEEEGRPLFWRGFMEDITDRKVAEAALVEAEARYRALVENIPVLTYIEELEGGRMLYVSPQVEVVSGYTQDERIADPGLWQRIIHPDDVAPFREANLRAERTGERFSLEYRINARDGRVVWMHDEAVLVRDPEGRPLFWQGVAFDITERVAAEEERERLLSHLVTAQEEERSRIGVRIHDEPIQKMTAVDLRLQMLRGHLDESGRPLLDALQSTIREAIASMRGLLVELRPPQLDEEGLATALVEYLSRPPIEIVVRFSVDDRLDEEPPPAVRTLAYRIGQEAITNVWKHARAEHVHLELARESDGLRVTIHDDGAGFQPDLTSPTAGHIGIQTMRERAEMGGGWLELESAPGSGTTVRFWLPWSTR